MRDLLYRFAWKCEKLIAPTLKYSQYHYYDELKRVIPRDSSWLDLGCGHQMFANWMMEEERELASRARRLVGIDLDLAGLKQNQFATGRIYGDLERLPFLPGSFDVVTANMVVEHLGDPSQVLAEVHRVLKPGGMFIFHTPNRRCVMMSISALLPQKLKNLLVFILENRKEEDVFPTFYRMNTFGSIAATANQAAFRLTRVKSFCSSAITSIFGPLVIFELLYLRLLEHERFQGIRSNLIAIMQKPS
jgi:ubiquinone/menaquinone biosynthesis C-methylase UbiE